MRNWIIGFTVAGVCTALMLNMSYCEPFTVNYVIDGDTLVTEDNETLRLARIDTPEKGQDGAKRATERLRELTTGDTCFIDQGEGYYDRTIAEIKANGTNVSDVLLDDNLANKYDKR